MEPHMKRAFNIFLVAAALSALVSCQRQLVSVNADFTTDKDVYELYEDVKITNDPHLLRLRG